MNQYELMWIKNAKKEFNQKFNKKLVIDYVKTSGINDARIKSKRIFDYEKVTKWIKNYVKKYKIDLEIVKNKKLSSKYHKEYKFIKDYASFLRKENLRYDLGAELIGKERTTLRHHFYNCSEND